MKNPQPGEEKTLAGQKSNSQGRERSRKGEEEKCQSFFSSWGSLWSNSRPVRKTLVCKMCIKSERKVFLQFLSSHMHAKISSNCLQCGIIYNLWQQFVDLVNSDGASENLPQFNLWALQAFHHIKWNLCYTCLYVLISPLMYIYEESIIFFHNMTY